MQASSNRGVTRLVPLTLRRPQNGEFERQISSLKNGAARGTSHSRSASHGVHRLRRKGSRLEVRSDRAAAPPEGAPNVLIVLIDDVGFGASSAFGGPCAAPTAERLAKDGLRYTRFHTTALCSPTRAALLSGRNHHIVGMGGITEIATSAPGLHSMRPNSMAPLPEILQAQWLLDGAVWKVSRSAGLGSQPGRPLRSLADGFGLRVFLRLRCRRDQSMVSGDSRRYEASSSRRRRPKRATTLWKT